MSKTVGHIGKRFGDAKRSVKDRGNQRMRSQVRKQLGSVRLGIDPDGLWFMDQKKNSADWWWYD